MILTKLGKHVNEMMAVAIKSFRSFLVIRQNVNMATNAILYCGLSPETFRSQYSPSRLTVHPSFGSCYWRRSGRTSDSQSREPGFDYGHSNSLESGSTSISKL